MCNGHKSKESCCLCGPPFTTGTVWQGHHYCLQLFTCNLKLTDALEFHGFPCQIFLWGHSICKDIQQEGPTARCMHSECNNVTHYRLKNRKFIQWRVCSLSVLSLITYYYLVDETPDQYDPTTELHPFYTYL